MGSTDLKHFVILVFLPLLVTSCGLFPTAEPKKVKTVMYQWHDDGDPGAVNIEIDLSKAFVPRLYEVTEVGTPVKIIRGNWPRRTRKSFT